MSAMRCLKGNRETSGQCPARTGACSPWAVEAAVSRHCPTPAIALLGRHPLSINWKPTFFYHQPCSAFPLAYSSFRICCTRDDCPLSVHVGQARITRNRIQMPSISGPSNKPTSTPAHSCGVPQSHLFWLQRRYRVLGGHPFSNRNAHAEPKLFFFLQSTSIRHSSTRALHPSHGNIHVDPHSMHRILQESCRSHTFGTK